MSKAETNMIIKGIVDAVMTVLLLCFMAYQVTGEKAHEWIGMGMTVLVIVHQILNRKWYGALFRPKRTGEMSSGHFYRKGKHNPYRSITTVLNILLIASFALTAFCGMSMSSYAVPFLYGMAPVSFVRRMHLSMSHWAFVLMGLHLGMHIPAMTAMSLPIAPIATPTSAAFKAGASFTPPPIDKDFREMYNLYDTERNVHL